MSLLIELQDIFNEHELIKILGNYHGLKLICISTYDCFHEIDIYNGTYKTTHVKNIHRCYNQYISYYTGIDENMLYSNYTHNLITQNRTKTNSTYYLSDKYDITHSGDIMDINDYSKLGKIIMTWDIRAIHDNLIFINHCEQGELGNMRIYNVDTKQESKIAYPPHYVLFANKLICNISERYYKDTIFIKIYNIIENMFNEHKIHLNNSKCVGMFKVDNHVAIVLEHLDKFHIDIYDENLKLIIGNIPGKVITTYKNKLIILNSTINVVEFNECKLNISSNLEYSDNITLSNDLYSAIVNYPDKKIIINLENLTIKQIDTNIDILVFQTNIVYIINKSTIKINGQLMKFDKEFDDLYFID